MQGTFFLARYRKAWLCVLSSMLMMLPDLTQADDPFDDIDFLALAPAIGTKSSSSYDVSTTNSGGFSSAEVESEAVKLHVRNQPLSRINATIKPSAGITPETRVAENSVNSLTPQHSLEGLTLTDELFLVGQGRPWAFYSVEWEAPATKHLPLLFEEPNLERLGYAYGVCDIGICDEEPRRGQRLQTLVSGAHFFGRVPFLPYMAGIRPLTEPVYTLGADRPGSPVPYRKYYPHWSLKGAIYQAGAAVGAVFIIP
jgi:hypothetical protein